MATEVTSWASSLRRFGLRFASQRYNYIPSQFEGNVHSISFEFGVRGEIEGSALKEAPIHEVAELFYLVISNTRLVL